MISGCDTVWLTGFNFTKCIWRTMFRSSVVTCISILIGMISMLMHRKSCTYTFQYINDLKWKTYLYEVCITFKNHILKKYSSFLQHFRINCIWQDQHSHRVSFELVRDKYIANMLFSLDPYLKSIRVNNYCISKTKKIIFMQWLNVTVREKQVC